MSRFCWICFFSQFSQGIPKYSEIRVELTPRPLILPDGQFSGDFPTFSVNSLRTSQGPPKNLTSLHRGACTAVRSQQRAVRLRGEPVRSRRAPPSLGFAREGAPSQSRHSTLAGRGGASRRPAPRAQPYGRPTCSPCF